MRALVTGSSGFIGQNLCERLIEDGHEVVAIDLRSPSSLLMHEHCAKLIVDDVENIFTCTNMGRFDVVFHLAALTSAPESFAEPSRYIRQNIEMATFVAQFASWNKMGAHLVFPSSIAVYGTTNFYGGFAINEDSTKYAARSPYGATKKAAEEILKMVCNYFATELTILRLANVYGPPNDVHRPRGVIQHFALEMYQNNPVQIFGDGNQMRDWVYVDDVVEAMVRSVDTVPSTLVIGAGDSYSVFDVFGRLAAFSGYELEPELVPLSYNEDKYVRTDPTRARRLIGWEPKVDLDTGLQRTVAKVRELYA